MVCLNGGGAGHYHEIETGEPMLVQPEGFSGQSLDSVAVLGQFHVTLRYRQAQARTIHSVGFREHGQVLVGRAARGFENTPEGARCRDAARTRKTVKRLGQTIRRSGVCGPWRDGH